EPPRHHRRPRPLPAGLAPAGDRRVAAGEGGGARPDLRRRRRERRPGPDAGSGERPVGDVAPGVRPAGRPAQDPATAGVDGDPGDLLRPRGQRPPLAPGRRDDPRRGPRDRPAQRSAPIAAHHDADRAGAGPGRQPRGARRTGRPPGRVPGAQLAAHRRHPGPARRRGRRLRQQPDGRRSSVRHRPSARTDRRAARALEPRRLGAVRLPPRARHRSGHRRPVQGPRDLAGRTRRDAQHGGLVRHHLPPVPQRTPVPPAGHRRPDPGRAGLRRRRTGPLRHRGRPVARHL
ncbi:MAG: Polysaccharide deacetylase, partial [uncultured Blastococcus sp.]